MVLVLVLVSLVRSGLDEQVERERGQAAGCWRWGRERGGSSASRVEFTMNIKRT